MINSDHLWNAGVQWKYFSIHSFSLLPQNTFHWDLPWSGRQKIGGRGRSTEAFWHFPPWPQIITTIQARLGKKSGIFSKIVLWSFCICLMSNTSKILFVEETIQGVFQCRSKRRSLVTKRNKLQFIFLANKTLSSLERCSNEKPAENYVADNSPCIYKVLQINGDI